MAHPSALCAVLSSFRSILSVFFLIGLSHAAFSQQWTTSGANIYNSNTGNVGIGTTSPAYALDVNGIIRAQGGKLILYNSVSGISATCLAMHMYNGCGSLGYLTFGFNPTSGAGTSTPDPLTIQQSNMSVGVGINQPQAKLHVLGAGTTGGTSSFLVHNSAGTEMFRIADNGYVGVGTTSPRSNLDVNGYVLATTGVSVAGNGFSGNVPLNGFTLRYEYPNGTFSIGSGSGYGYLFRTNNAARLLINDANVEVLNTNMLVNTQTDNGNKVQVNGNLWTTGLILPTGAAAGKVLTSDASGNATWQTASSGGTSGWALTGNAAINPSTTFVGTTDNSAVAFRAGNVERMRIDGNSGNILIGKTSQTNAGYLLDVNGIIRGNRVIVNTSGDDFVFDPGYRLSPLSEVERFVLTHHHLSQIAPASEMQAQGVDVEELQVKLLAKVEELTLYIIDQDKRLAQQQKLLEQIQKKMESR